MHYNAPMKISASPVILFTCLALLAVPADAARRLQAGATEPARMQSRTLSEGAVSLDEAVARAEQRHNARVVKAERRKRGERTVYRIRLLGADGRVFEVTVDAETGAER